MPRAASGDLRFTIPINQGIVCLYLQLLICEGFQWHFIGQLCKIYAYSHRANEAAAVDLRGVRASTLLPQVGRRTGFSVWTGDERLSTFVISSVGAPPRDRDLQRLKILDSREPRPAEGPVEAPKVLKTTSHASETCAVFHSLHCLHTFLTHCMRLKHAVLCRVA